MYPVYGLAEATLVVSFPQPPASRCTNPSPSIATRSTWARRRRRCPRIIRTRCRIMAVGQQVPYTRGAHRRRRRPGAARESHRPHPHLGRQRHQGLFRKSGSERQGLHRRRLAAHRRSRNDPGRQAVHHRPREGNHLRQRPELLPARHREHRDPRRRPRARQGRGRRRAAQGREHRRSHPLRAASHGHEGIPAAGDAGGAAGQRTHGPRSGARGAGEAHPEDHQRQDPASPARRGLS